MSEISVPRHPLPGAPVRAAAALLLLLLASALAPPRAAAADPQGADPIEGRWWGKIGSPRERIEVGLELRRSADGALALALTQPVMNYFGVAVPLPVVREGDRIRVEGLLLDLRLVDGRLEGHFPGPNSPASLVRVDSLPAEPPVPELPAGPEPRWRTRLNGQVFAGPTLSDGLAYVGTTGGVMQAVDLADGKVVWTFAAGGPIFGDAAVDGDAIYFVSDLGLLHKLERADGKELWRYDLGDARVPRVLPHPAVFDWDWQAPKPLVAGGAVYVGGGDGLFHAVDAATGARRFRFAAGGKIRNGAALDGDRILFGSADRFVYALDRTSGRELWRHDSGAEVDATPVVHGGKVLVGNRGAGLIALDAATGERLWRTYFWGSWVESTPVVVDGVIYLGSSDLRRVSAIDPADGRVLWRSDVYGWTWGTPVVAGDRIYAGAAGGAPYVLRHVAGLAALDRATGRILWRNPLPEVVGAHQWGIAGSPALAGDLLVVTTIAGEIAAYPVATDAAAAR